MNIIEELYYGNINPIDKRYDHNSQYAKFSKIIADNEKKISVYLSLQTNAKDELELFLKLMRAQDEVLDFSEANSFIEGFQLGAKFIVDSLVAPQGSVLRDIS